MLQKTALYMEKYRMAAPGEKMIVGLSGGMDSVCLFYILLELGYRLEAVHVHHGIRGQEADRDEAFVRSLCERYRVPLHSFRFDVPGISRAEHLTEEEAGRKVRRQAFLQVWKESGAGHIALAHHANDRAETMLFHLCRGTGIKGIASMRPCSGVFIRPLLWAERREIAAYMEERRYEYVEDTTNASAEYTRNKLRHQVVPLLEEINRGAAAHLCAAAEKLSEAADYIDGEARKLEERCVVWADGGALIVRETFLAGAQALRVPVLQNCIGRLSGSLADVGQEHFLKILALFEMQVGRELHLPGGLAAARTYEGVRLFRRAEERAVLEPVEISGEGSFCFGGRKFRVSVEEWDETKNFPRKTYTKCFDYDKIKGNVFLRARQPGDYLEINRAGGRKRLQDYFVNEKVPKEERERIPVIADGSHILWVVGMRISEYYKVTEKTRKVLKVQTDGGNEDGFYGKRIDSAGKGRSED